MREYAVNNPKPQPHYAMRRDSRTLHIVTNVVNWYEGMMATSECGIRLCSVNAQVADRENMEPDTCKRCIKTLGWNYPLRRFDK